MTTYQLSVCNRSSKTLHVVFVHPEAQGSSEWTMRGWFEVKGSACRDLGAFPKGLLHYFANSSTKIWTGKDGRYCTPNSVVNRRARPAGKCPRGERVRGFHEAFVDSEKYTLSLLP